MFGVNNLRFRMQHPDEIVLLLRRQWKMEDENITDLSINRDYCIKCSVTDNVSTERGFICNNCEPACYPLQVVGKYEITDKNFADYRLKTCMKENETLKSDQWCKCAKKEQVYLTDDNFKGGYVCSVCIISQNVIPQ